MTQEQLTNQPRSRPSRRRPGAVVGAVSLALALTACGGSSGGVTVPKVAPAGTYSLQHFQPAGPVVAGRATTLSFTIQQPSGHTLAAYRPCCEPHDGVDLIIVRSDDSHIQYSDSDISPSGQVTQPIVFPTPGRYRVIVDAYPAHTAVDAPINFQLFTWVTVKGHYRKQALPPYHATRGGGRLPLPDPASSGAQGDPGHVPDDQGHRPEWPQGRVRYLAGGARPFDLHPPGLAGLLPHPRVQPRRDILHLGAGQRPR